ncbi:MAG: hypothetical protein NZ919_01475 [Candidatus Caldarchaeum sp.]|nr:hypothetical protein [Candidatus Caldarchaeum sp.]
MFKVVLGGASGMVGIRMENPYCLQAKFLGFFLSPVVLHGVNPVPNPSVILVSMKSILLFLVEEKLIYSSLGHQPVEDKGAD